jgi:hypothetical protein
MFGMTRPFQVKEFLFLTCWGNSPEQHSPIDLIGRPKRLYRRGAKMNVKLAEKTKMVKIFFIIHPPSLKICFTG